MSNNWRRTLEIYNKIDTREDGKTIYEISKEYGMSYTVVSQIYYDFLCYAKKSSITNIYNFLCELEKHTNAPLRVYKALSRANVVTIDDLLALSDEDIMNIPQIGVSNKRGLILIKNDLIDSSDELRVPIVFYKELYFDLSKKAEEFGIEFERFVQQMAYLGLQQVSKTEIKEVVK